MSTYNRARDRDERGRLKRHYRRPAWSGSTPGWWVRTTMNRPRRRLNRHLCGLVVKGREPDALLWPVGGRKPHVYYW